MKLGVLRREVGSNKRLHIPHGRINHGVSVVHLGCVVAEEFDMCRSELVKESPTRSCQCLGVYLQAG